MKDVVLARALDDSTFNVLNSCIIFNQIDIINHVQNDISFLKDVVGLYVDEDMLSGGGTKKKEESEKVISHKICCRCRQRRGYYPLRSFRESTCNSAVIKVTNRHGLSFILGSK